MNTGRNTFGSVESPNSHLSEEERKEGQSWDDLGSALRKTSSGENAPAENDSSFEFHPQLLKTVEGRSEVFREMVRMFNEVRKKRDELGFGEERDAEGNITQKAYRNVKNVDFDGFLAFRSRYFKLRKFILEYSERGAVRGRDGKIEGVQDVEITNEEGEEFAKEFGFLKTYYGRAERFEKEEGEEAAPVNPVAAPVAAAVVLPEQIPVPPVTETHSKFESRGELREVFLDWRAKKKAYHEAYAEYLSEGSALRGLAARRFLSEPHPQELLYLQAQYNQAREKYAEKVDVLYGAQFKQSIAGGEVIGDIADRASSAKAMLANHFLFRAVRERRAIEKERVLPSKAAELFEGLQKNLKKHKGLMKILGYGAAIGVGAMTGTLVASLFGKVASGKAALVGAAGATFAASNLYDTFILDKKERIKDNAYAEAQRSYSAKDIVAQEEEILRSIRAYEEASSHKKYVVAGAAIAGGVLASAALGNVDMEEIIENTPDVGEPELPSTPNLVTDEPSLEPEPEPVPAEEPVVADDPKSIDAVPKGDELMNVPGTDEPDAPVFTPQPHFDPGYTPEEIPSDDATPEAEPIVEAPEPLLFTFESGAKINTVSEALFESWKADPELMGEQLTKKEFLAEMYTAIAEIEKDPFLNKELMEEMGIRSGDIDKVQVGQTIDLQPFFEYLKTK